MANQSIERKGKRKASEITSRRAATRDRVSKMMRSENRCKEVKNAPHVTNDALHNHIWREQVSQWCYDVVDHLNASREVVFTTMAILDRYITKTSSVSNKIVYERTAITAFFLALRISSSPAVKISQLLSLSRSSLQPRDILTTGTKILEALKWDNKILTPQAFVKVFIALLPSDMQGRVIMSWLELSMYLVEISVCDGNFAQVPSSQIAAAAIHVAMKKTASFQVDKKTFDSFVRDMREETNIDFSSVNMQSLCTRLQNIYSQSQECSQLERCNVIEDDAAAEEMPLIESPQITTARLGTEEEGVVRPISPILEEDC
eukprot:scaffold473_cov132-Cylindrotheca_fusiformis.AAC.9